ncbi:MAG: autotransporter-associated beta strand repeat-containing protein [Chthoniobacterales bacterium]
MTAGTGGAIGYTIHTFTNTGNSSFNLTGVNFNTRLGATLSGTLTGTGGLTYEGPGALTLAASNSFSGVTRAAGGSLDLGNVNALVNSTLDMNAADSGAVNLTLSGQTYNIAGLQGSRALALSNNRISVGANGTNTIYSGAMSGTGGLTKVGGGALTLSGSNTYSGATTVSGGNLVVNGSINSSTVTVSSGGTLSGSGSVGGIVINTGGTISPGNSPGTQNATTNVVWNGGGNYNWQIFNASGTKGSTNGWDWLNTSGSLDLSSLSVTNQFNINLWSLSGITPDTNGSAIFFTNTSSYTWTILTASNGITGFSADKFAINLFATNGTAGFANALGGGTFSIAQSGNDLNLVFSTPAIPEPGTWAAALLLMGAAGYVRWRNRTKVS